MKAVVALIVAGAPKLANAIQEAWRL